MTSPYAPDECIARLRKEIESPWKLFSKTPIAGIFDFEGVRYTDRSRLLKNLPGSIMTVTLREKNGGTELLFKARLNRIYLSVYAPMFLLMLVVIAETIWMRNYIEAAVFLPVFVLLTTILAFAIHQANGTRAPRLIEYAAGLTGASAAK